MVKHTTEWQIFLQYLCEKEILYYKSCKRRFHHKYSGVHVSDSSTIFRLVKKVHSAGSVYGKNYTTENIVLTKKVPDKTGARLEHLPKKYLAQSAKGAQVSRVHVESN
jgi:hypothetical protein